MGEGILYVSTSRDVERERVTAVCGRQGWVGLKVEQYGGWGLPSRARRTPAGQLRL